MGVHINTLYTEIMQAISPILALLSEKEHLRSVNT